MSGRPVANHSDLCMGYRSRSRTSRTRPGVRTTYGSTAFADNVPAVDSLVVARLKAAGAIIVGKTNTPEFGVGSHTFNAVFGATRNPWALHRSAGGSSGGAGAALAAGLVPIADGSDHGGSIRNPASFNNVVGLRPTPGLVPDSGETDIWDVASVVGPMARTVGDLALMLTAIAGPDPRAPLSHGDPAAFAGQLRGDLAGAAHRLVSRSRRSADRARGAGGSGKRSRATRGARLSCRRCQRRSERR